MQTLITFVDRKTNKSVCSTFVNLSVIKDTDLSPTELFDYIWENALKEGIEGNQSDYLIHLFNHNNHKLESPYISSSANIIQQAKIKKTRNTVIFLQDYKNQKVRKYAI